MRETLKQPNGSTVYIDDIPESGSCYSKEDMDNGIKNTFLAKVFVTQGYNSFHNPYGKIKRFWYDNIGLYTYKNQKKPIYYWKSQNIEEDYDNWSKDENGHYKIPLNEPRKIKKNYFQKMTDKYKDILLLIGTIIAIGVLFVYIIISTSIMFTILSTIGCISIINLYGEYKVLKKKK